MPSTKIQVECKIQFLILGFSYIVRPGNFDSCFSPVPSYTKTLPPLLSLLCFQCDTLDSISHDISCGFDSELCVTVDGQPIILFMEDFKCFTI